MVLPFKYMISLWRNFRLNVHFLGRRANWWLINYFFLATIRIKINVNMLYPRGICLFPPLPPIPSFHKASPYTGSSFKIASRRQWGGEGGGGGGEEEESSLALLASLVDFLPLFPTKKPGLRLAQNANAQRLVWIAHKNWPMLYIILWLL